MAHTHMVKGLDYALLQKVVLSLLTVLHVTLLSQVRSEMLIRDREEEEMKLLERKREKERATSFREQQHSAKKGEITFRTKMGLLPHTTTVSVRHLISLQQRDYIRLSLITHRRQKMSSSCPAEW